LSFTARGPWLVATTVATLPVLTLASSKVTTMALLPLADTGDEVIWLTVLPTKASP